MDWPTFFKEYPSVVTAVSGLLGIVLGHFFGKRNAERTRKWEVKDRHLKEAQSYLINYRIIIEATEKYETAVLDMLKNYDEFYKGNSESQIRGKIKLRYGDSMSALDELPKLMWDSAEMNTSIIVLGDRELSKLDRKLRLQVSQERGSMHNFINRALAEEEGKDEVLEDDIKKRLEEVSDFSVQAHFLIADMKLRLDKLAQKT